MLMQSMRDGTGLSVIKGQRMLVRVEWTFKTSSRVAPQEFILSRQMLGQVFLFVGGKYDFINKTMAGLSVVSDKW